MENDSSEVSEPPALPVGPPKKGSCLLVGFIVLCVLLLAGAVAFAWINRPIRAVELSEKEAVVLEKKMGTLESVPEEPVYEKGSKEIILTERELNGLLNKNTDLGGKLHFDLVTDEVHARIETDLDEDLPVVGGKKFKARARFFVKSTDGSPSLVLDDLTVWGVSLPNDWLAGMKGKDLLSEIFGGGSGIQGVRELKVERGQLVLRLAE